MSKEMDQHINVFVRVKPLSQKEIADNCMKAVHAASEQEIILYEQSHDKTAKQFTFDKVFGPTSSQVDVYETVVRPLIKEVLAGYNCTVFAYGQTGTGKTYTMEGGRDSKLFRRSENSNSPNDCCDKSAGMIPRCLSHLFDELQAQENQQYVVKVSFVELYNEKLFDLLSHNDDNAQIKLYDNTSKKGSVVILGLQEVTVRDKAEVYKTLERGTKRKQVASTAMNAHSNRSHTIFCINIHVKQDSNKGEKLLKVAKLNLVDLAGSENISKSMVVDKRMRETKTINQSLLTLGRVITALVEKAPHVPYRESKLTRLLQESLGGCTKTSIIATISSSSSNVDETLSTLDYAHRAKHITNRPEINQKLYKKALLKEYMEELERLKKDVTATQQRYGIHLSQDKYNSMHDLVKWQRKEIKTKMNDIKILEEEVENRKNIIDNIQSQYDAETNELRKRMSELNDLISSLQSTTDSVKHLEHEKNEHKYIVEKYVETDKILHNQIKILSNVIDEASEDKEKLHDKLDRLTEMKEKNEKFELQMKDNFEKQVKHIKDNLAIHREGMEYFFASVKNEVQTHIAAQAKNIETSIFPIVKEMVHKYFSQSEQSEKNINISYAYYQNLSKKNTQDTSTVIEYEKNLLSDIYSKVVSEIHDVLKHNKNYMGDWRTLSSKLSHKLEDASTYAKNVIDIVCTRQLEECNSLRSNLSEISKYINRMFLNEKQVAKNYKLFAKKMENISNELTLLNKCEEIYSEKTNLSNKIGNICNNIQNQSSENHKENLNRYNSLKEFTQNTFSQIKNDINSNQTQIFRETAVERHDAVINDIEKELNTGCATLKQYNDTVKFNAQQLQKRMTDDKDKLVASNNITSKMLQDMKIAYIDFMKQQQNESLNFPTISDMLTTQSTELNNLNKKTVEEINELQQNVDKFFIEDLHRDTSAGTTPPRKKFVYPRQFATTLPHEQLIQEFRESRYIINSETNNLDSSLMSKSIPSKQLFADISTDVSTKCLNISPNSPTMSNITYGLPYDTSTPYKNRNTKKIEHLRS